ncbi:hypothetical protein E2C01_015960 [Portunus trituberculatus]|uniref:Uncharacterized protein n=1 Tax=Portunus trituberculatus TaxID=210409 RepID=A0A5B7DN76_PORTR|nr:hypothetical protein [Portunus trituberculatus]
MSSTQLSVTSLYFTSHSTPLPVTPLHHDTSQKCTGFTGNKSGRCYSSRHSMLLHFTSRPSLRTDYLRVTENTSIITPK